MGKIKAIAPGGVRIVWANGIENGMSLGGCSEQLDQITQEEYAKALQVGDYARHEENGMVGMVKGFDQDADPKITTKIQNSSTKTYWLGGLLRLVLWRGPPKVVPRSGFPVILLLPSLL